MGKIAVLLVLLFATGTAKAATIQTTDTSRPWQTWTDRAQVPTWSGTLPLVVIDGWIDCGGLRAAGCTSATPNVDQTSGQIMPPGTPLASVSTEVYNDPDAWYAKAAFYHELGQVFWSEYLTSADEAAFMQIVGLGGDTSQWGNWLYGSTVRDGVTYHFPPFEWFAEGYRYCAQYGINQPLGVRDEEGLFYPGDQPGFDAHQREVCQLIDRVGLDNGIVTPTQATYSARPKTRPAGIAHVHVHPVQLTRGRRRVW